MAIQMMPSAAQSLTGPRSASKKSDDSDSTTTSGAEAFAGFLAAAQQTQPQPQNTPSETGSAGQTDGDADDQTISATRAPQGKGLVGSAANALEQAPGLDHSTSPVALLVAGTDLATEGSATGHAGSVEQTEDAAKADQASKANSKLFETLGETVPELVSELDPGEVGKAVSAAAHAQAADVHDEHGHGRANGLNKVVPPTSGSTSNAAATGMTNPAAETSGSTTDASTTPLDALLATSGAKVTTSETKLTTQAGDATQATESNGTFDRILGTVTKADVSAAKSHASPTGATSSEASASGAHKSPDGTVTVAPVGVPATPQAAASTSVAAPEVVSTDPSLGLHEQLAEPVLAVRTRGNGTHTLTVEVHPNDLGPVQVQVRVDGTSTSVTVTGTHDAHDVLRAAMPALHAELRAAGLHDLDLNLGTATPNPNSQDNPSRSAFAGLDNGFGAGGTGGHANHEARGQQPGAHPDGAGAPVRNDVNRPTRTRSASGVDRLL